MGHLQASWQAWKVVLLVFPRGLQGELGGALPTLRRAPATTIASTTRRRASEKCKRTTNGLICLSAAELTGGLASSGEHMERMGIVKGVRPST
jgi:hypothetical protein